MQGESRWPRRCGSETRNSPIHAGLENQTAEDQETQVSLSSRRSVLFDSRKFGTSRSLVIRRLPLTACFQYIACGLHLAFPLASVAGNGGNAQHHDDNR